MEDVTTHGPLFDGRALAIMSTLLENIKTGITNTGENEIHNRLGQVLKNPTGFYESKIHTERQMNDRVITDTPVIYGPWLEGVGSRNKTTRFKGYATFRLISQKLNAEVPAIIAGTVTKSVGELNGI